MRRPCTIDNCGREGHAAGLCTFHYNRRRLGREMDGPRPRSSQAKVPDAAVRHIRAHDFKPGDAKRFAGMYGVAASVISYIRAGKIYKDIT